MNQTSEFDICVSIILNQQYITLCISILNFIFNFMNCIIFIRIVKIDRNNKLFKLLMIKSITDAYCGINFLLRSWSMVLKYNSNFFSESKFQMICFLIFSRYLGFVIQLISKITECFACFDRLIILKPSYKNKTNFLTKILYICLIMFSFLFYIYKFFQNKLVIVELDKTNKTLYTVETDVSSHYLIIDFIHSFLKDFFCLLLSFAFNILTLIIVIRSSRKRRYLSNLSDSNSTSRGKVDKNDFKIIVMITITTLISGIGHWGNFITFLPIHPNIFMHSCFQSISYYFVEISYAGNFVIYLFFNKRFRVIFFDFFSFIKLN